MKHRQIESRSLARFLVSSLIKTGRPFYFGSVILGLICLLIFRRWQRILIDFFQFKPVLSLTKPKIVTTIPRWVIVYQAQPLWLKTLLKWLKNLVMVAYGILLYFIEAITSPIRIPLFILIWPLRAIPSPPLVKIGVALSLIFLILTGSSWGLYQWIFKDLPDPEELATRQPQLTTKIFDRHGKELYSIYKDENRTLIKLSDLPPHVVQATLAIEDADFYHHPGFSMWGILRAVKVNATKDKVQGGSTITQQLVKNTLLTPERNFRRKVRELFLAIAVDAIYEKNQILEMYFNQIPYGGSTYGIEEAALRFFGKHARELDLAEAALLAGLPAATTTYSPFGTTPELAIDRQHEVLRRMVEEGYITPEQSLIAMEEPLKYREDRTPILAPHFVMYVRSLLAEIYGEDMVTQGGLEVYTTLDLSIQDEAQKIVTDEVDQLTKYRISNGAALVTKPSTGEILAMIGSKNYFDIKNDGQVNLTYRLRQPGSSIKPLTYALALEKGQTPSSTVLDAPVTFQIPGSTPYSPKNYDGRFHGNVTLRQALANSYNVPAVKLLNLVGVERMIDRGHDLGIDTWTDKKRFGLSLTLGGGEVYMTDMAELYGTFANDGYTVDLNPFLLVKNSKGEILYQNTCVNDSSTCPRRRSLDPRIAYQITDILSDNQARSSAFGINSVLNIPGQQVAVKTGTTNSLRDNWTIGYTTDRLVATWVGNNDNTPMSYVASGITGASPIWNKIIRTQLNPDQPHVFKAPENLVKVAVCLQTGTLPCQSCPSVKEEYYLPGTEPKKACTADFFKPKDNEEQKKRELTQPIN